MQSLIKNSQSLVAEADLSKKRYLYDKIDFSQKLIGILGQRGVGKTTLMLQYLKEKEEKDSIYFSADDIFFTENTLKETVETLHSDYGFQVFCIDEIHKYKNWNQELKNIYDLIPGIKIIFSGSSSLDIISGAYDLSRRAVIYNLAGLSFREFLEFKTGETFSSFTLTDLFEKYKRYSVEISGRADVSSLFKEYLAKGYYPYFLEGDDSVYFKKLENALNKTIYEDIANQESIKTEHLYLFRKILSFLATSSPGKVNTNRLSSSLGVAFETAESYLDIMKRISLARYLPKNTGGHNLIRKPEKIFLDNTNILELILNSLGVSEEGAQRELFVLNQVQNAEGKIFASKKGDCLIKEGDKDFILEIGGESKNFKQIRGVANSYLALDGVQIAEENKMPLYLFGFLY